MWILCAVPFLFQVGPAADTLVQRGVAVTTVRKLFQGFAFVGSAACMIACGLITPQNTAGGLNFRDCWTS